MSTIEIKYSPSINIVRDSNYQFNYIPTPNSIAVFNQLVNELNGKNKSHIIIGAYGIGKSSLLLAMKQTLSNIQKHFKYETTGRKSVDFEFVSLVGTYGSFAETIADIFLPSKKNYTTKEI